ncbi:autotransporter-associated N-terminal domain-containing protein [Fusobacterium varium]|uniref:autotransporter-associated N-terminal domain-containing protein n=1 Tax=Fusobacterium varium TaxID=856 RepID=UPI002FE442E9
MKKNDIEKSLKRFLKRKISYSLSLLIAFMITGGISFGAGITTEEIQESKAELLSKVQAEKEEIKKKIIENEQLIKEYNSELLDLLKKGNFYSKSMFPSTQVFFTYQNEKNGKMKNRTKKEFSETIKAAQEFYPQNIILNKLETGNGNIIDTRTFREEIDLGININVPEIEVPKVSKAINVNVTIPNVGISGIKNLLNPKVPKVNIPKVDNISVAISKPNSINLNQVTINKNEKIDVEVKPLENVIIPENNIITKIDIPLIQNIKLEIPKITTPVINFYTPSYTEPQSIVNYSRYYNNANDVYWDNSKGLDAIIGNVVIKKGDFKVKRIDSKKLKYRYENYSVYNATTETALGDNNDNLLSQGEKDNQNKGETLSSGEQYAFIKVNGYGNGISYNNGNILYTDYSISKDDLWRTTPMELVYFSAENFINKTDIENQIKKIVSGEEQVKISQAFKDSQSFIKTPTTDALVWINNGKITIEGQTTSVVRHYNESYNSGESHLINTGEITLQPYYDGNTVYGSNNIVFSGQGNNRNESVFYNAESGKINVWTEKSIAFNAGNDAWNKGNSILHIVNKGSINLYAPSNIGVFMYPLPGKTVNLSFKNAPINIFGDNSAGLYAYTDNDINTAVAGDFYINIGLPGEGQKNFTTMTTDGVKLEDYNVNNSTWLGTELIDSSIGIFYSTNLNHVSGKEIKLSSHGINIYDQTRDSVGVLFSGSNSNSRNLNLGSGKILLSGGKENVGIFARGKGNVISKGSIQLKDGTGNRAVIASGTNIEVENIEVLGNINDSIVITAEGDIDYWASVGLQGTVDIKGKTKIKVTATGEVSSGFSKSPLNSIGAYANTFAKITINNSGNRGTADSPDIEIIGLNGKEGIALYAKKNKDKLSNEVVINAENNYIKVDNGQAGVISLNGGEINLKNSILHVNNGIAISTNFEEGVNKVSDIVDISGGKIILEGTSLAYIKDCSAGSINPIKSDSDTKIEVKSNDIIAVAKLDNVGQLNLGTLKTDLENKIGATIIDDGVHQDYRLALINGGSINIDQDISQSSTNKNSMEYIFYNRFLGEKFKINIADGITANSTLTNEEADKFGNGNVIGMKVTSSESAASVADTQINLGTGSKIVADRTESGNGAIGAYINYGQVTLGTNSRIEVEKGNNIVNSKGVGVYAVNGSEVKIEGTIDIAGNKGIGILAQAYRVGEDGNPIVSEFGGKPGEGTLTVENKGDILLSGEGTIGIYADNNRQNGLNTSAEVKNIGKIQVGSSKDDVTAIGIYAKNAVISNTGEIITGKNGIGIYGIKGSNITDLGTINLGTDAIGVMVDGTSQISGSNITLKSNGNSNKERIGIFYKGTGNENTNVNINLDAEDMEKGIALYAENMNSFNSTGAIKVGENGTGIYVKNGSGTNGGTINLVTGKNNAIGMGAVQGTITNTGTITLNSSSQIGMTGLGNGSIVKNTNLIDIKPDKGIGIYVKDGAKAELTGNNIAFGGKSNIGVYAENGIVNIKQNLSFTNNNENKNIYVYGKDSVVGIDAGSIVKVDGLGISNVPGTEGNKTVGIYIENAGTGSTFNGAGNLEVLNGAVGIYSKGNNTLDANITATGDKTTGVFIDGASTISGTVTSKTDAIGVYGSGGAVTISTGGLTLNTNSGKGTGMYLVDGAYAVGGLITVNNTSGTENIGVYYSRGTGSGAVTNSTDIKLTGTKSIGIYAADGINLVNTKIIESSTSNNIASYIGEDSILTSNGNITMSGADNIGIYTGKGSGINAGKIDLTSASGTSAGMVAKTATAGDRASVENKKDITVGANLGMYIAGNGTSSGKNSGTITATTGTGVYVEGANASFDGAAGIIKSDKLGIYLAGTDANKVSVGTLEIGSGGIGIFGENAKIDFAVNVKGDGAIGVAAQGNNSVISRDITTTGKGSIGVYLFDDAVAFANGVAIETGESKPDSGLGANDGKTSVGIYTKAAGNYVLNGVSVNAKDGVGVYLEDSTHANSGVKTLSYNGTITTTGGIGIYVEKGNNLVTQGTTININGGAGIYIGDGGNASLGGNGDNLVLNFGTNGGIGILNNGGTLQLGVNITMNGSGSFMSTTNGSLSSAGSLNIGKDSIGLIGQYDTSANGNYNITNTASGIINIVDGTGLAAVKKEGTAGPIPGNITVSNAGSINVESTNKNKPVAAIYTDIAKVENNGIINVGNNGVGIYTTWTNETVKNDNINITGTNGIGVYIEGVTNGLISNNINSTKSGNTGLVLKEVILPNINAGTITLGNESVGVMATATNSTINGTIKIGDSSSSKSAIGIAANGGSHITLTGTAITVGKGGIGVYAEGVGTSVIVSNTGNITVGTDGIYMYSKGAALTFTGNITADNQIGIVADGGSVTANGNSVITAKNGGIGIYVKNTAPTLGGTTIAVQGGTSSRYSIGAYYEGVKPLGAAIILPTITQTGDYNIGAVLKGSKLETGPTGISIGNSNASNQVGIMAKAGSNIKVNGDVSITGGNNNIGVYGENSIVGVNGNISVAEATSLTNSSIGVFVEKGSYTGIGNVSAGNNSIGIYGKNMTEGTISQSGTTMNVGTNGVGIYGAGSGNINLSMGTIALNDENSIGVYTKGLNSVVTGNMTIGTDTSIGIVSEGNGNVTYAGNMTIADKTKTGSVGIYKVGGTAPSTITSSGSWTVGNSGYGIYSKGQGITVNNNADMTLGMSSVGIFSNGLNTINNNGKITVGATDVNGDHKDTKKHLNSVGIFATAGTIVNNSGNITVNHDHSVGIYGDGIGTKITNTGNMTVDNGGVGILVKNGAVAVNTGNVTLGSTLASCGAVTVGMAAYQNSEIINDGIITVNNGVGMLVGPGGSFKNTGTIYVNNGIGIEGAGSFVNIGNVVVGAGGSATGSSGGAGSSGSATATIGSVQIDSNGNITINDNYVSIGGTLTTQGDITINGAYVDVTTGIPLFNAHSVNGEVNILPNFALTGNGISYEIKDFVNVAAGTVTGNKLTPVTSPLFVSKIVNGKDLVIVKRPYADLTIGNQFDALDKGLDNILANSGGNGKDADILKGLNSYLAGLSGEEFANETARTLAETRGDIYSTIQGRMQDINRAFDNSFYELESSYNLTKDSSKYSVIYTDGNYKDSTLGIDDYDYKVMGLLYMKEKEGTEYGSKYGYTLGFAGSKFDFDDGGSKEDVYSLRVGAHRVKNLSEEHKVSWLSRIELGYNRHIAKRKLELDKTYENKGEYNTYSVAFDNRLTKVMYTDLSRQLEVYTNLDLEYGKVDDFKESAGSKGGLEVQIKDNDYLSAQLGVGVNAQQRIYAGNDVSVKVTADVKYAYELGDNYDGNKARLKNGGEGYYSLITPEEREGKLTGKIGLTVEKANHMGVTFEVEAADESNKKDSSIKYGVRFNYKF